MVSIQSPISKKHTLSFGYTNISSGEKKIIKKAMKINKIKKKNKHIFYDICKNDFIGRSSSKDFGQMKMNTYSLSHYEEDIIPKTQRNTERGLRSESISETSYCKNEENYYFLEEDNNEVEDSMDFQYGSLIGNKQVEACVNDFLSNWSDFISDIDGSIKENHYESKEKKNFINSSSQGLISNNSGYLTPTSQNDEENFSESSFIFKEESTSSENVIDIKEEEELFNRNSPIVKDNFDDICPFDNDFNEDERMRKILNAEVLPNDYIGKIPYIPEKPMGDFGRLMKKYKF